MMHFYKYQGTGNDFVIVDNRDAAFTHLSQDVIAHICDRRFGIGADGFMLLNNKEGYDFEMIYYNADGREGSMCGNGGRCIVQFANDLGMGHGNYTFMAVDGEHKAEVKEGLVALKMMDVKSILEKTNDYAVLNTGSPHYVKQVKKLADINVFEEGKKIRYSEKFYAEGINVNFVEQIEDGHIKVNTYERGVEAETFSCGTGVTAAALLFYKNETGFNSIDIDVLGGTLKVSYNKNEDGSYSDIWLKGPAIKVFEGNMYI